MLKLKIKKIIIVTLLLLLIPAQMVGCNKSAQEAAPPVTAELTDEQYLENVMNGLGKTSDGFQQISILLEEPNKDAAWEAKMNIELEKIRAASLEYLGIQNVPERYSKVHEHITQAMLSNILAVDSFPVKSADQNAESLAITTGYIREGGASIEKAMEELDKVK